MDYWTIIAGYGLAFYFTPLAIIISWYWIKNFYVQQELLPFDENVL
jgi:hypothetical protein